MLGLIMQNVVLAAQNAVPPTHIGTAASTNNYFREVRATLGVAVFGTLFTSRPAENLTGAVAGDAEQAIVDAYANGLAPVFSCLVPILAVAFLLAVALEEIPLSDFAGMVARGEAVSSEEELTAMSVPAELEKVVILADETNLDTDRDDDPREAAARVQPAPSGSALRAGGRS